MPGKNQGKRGGPDVVRGRPCPIVGLGAAKGARLAEYPESIAVNLTPERLKRFFQKTDQVPGQTRAPGYGGRRGAEPHLRPPSPAWIPALSPQGEREDFQGRGLGTGMKTGSTLNLGLCTLDFGLLIIGRGHEKRQS